MKSKVIAHPLVLAAALSVLGAPGQALEQTRDPGPSDEPPQNVEQLLPRGGIPAIFEPVFVAASEAEIPDDAWVLGVSIGGESHAYSLNLLNSHEVVNDRIGEKNFAAVW